MDRTDLSVAILLSTSDFTFFSSCTRKGAAAASGIPLPQRGEGRRKMQLGLDKNEEPLLKWGKRRIMQMSYQAFGGSTCFHLKAVFKRKSTSAVTQPYCHCKTWCRSAYTGAQWSFFPGAGPAAMAPAWYWRLDLVLWASLVGGEADSQLLVIPNTAAWKLSKLCSCQLATCALGFALFAFWSQGGLEQTTDAYKSSLVYKSECLTPDAVPTKLQSVGAVSCRALLSLKETVFSGL